ncbi:MAG: phenylalanine--tRNA ligase subunit beta [Ferroplasma sp.]
MVVIKDSIDTLNKNIGNNYVSRLYEFSSVIGYTIEKSEDELKIEFNPDRPDLYSFYALKASMKIFYDSNFIIKSPLTSNDIKLEVEPAVLDERPYVLSFTAEGGPLGNYYEHIISYQERLHETIGKSRKKVAIGIHDLDKIKPPFKFSIADAKKLEFTTYDGYSGTAEKILHNHPKGIEFSKLIKSKKLVPVITDNENNVLSMPPVINGIKSRISRDTSNLFFDITGTDYNAVRSAFYLFAYEMSYLGYKVSTSEKSSKTLSYDFREIDMVEKEVARLIGVTGIDIIPLLRKMGFRCEITAAGFRVNVPGNRIDVMGPVDIIEDIAKAYGYDNIAEKKLKMVNTGQPYHIYADIDIINDILISLNYQEIKTFVLNSIDYYAGISYNGKISISNPKSMDYSVMRDRLYPGMLNFLRINKRRGMPVKIFEIGDVINNGVQETHLCLIYNNSKASYSDIYSMLQYFLKRSMDTVPVINRAAYPEIIYGRGGNIMVNGVYTGIIGEMAPEILKKFEIQNPLSFFEINLGQLLSGVPRHA